MWTTRWSTWPACRSSGLRTLIPERRRRLGAGGVDVGVLGTAPAAAPEARRCPLPDRAIDWADLQAFVPRFPEDVHTGATGPARRPG